MNPVTFVLTFGIVRRTTLVAGLACHKIDYETDQHIRELVLVRG